MDDSCIPPHLPLPPIDNELFVREAMGRHARLSAPFGMSMGIFAVLGPDEAPIAATQTDPAALNVMEEVSLAFHLVEQQRLAGEIVIPDNVERLVATLVAYYERTGRPRTCREIEELVERFIDEHSLPTAAPVGLANQEVKVELPMLYQLYSVDEVVQSRIIGMHGRPATLECVGLILDRRLDGSRYSHCTPLNCRTFASTGGDGAHFSLLVLDGAITEESPVVVTMPDSFGPSLIVAESLYDFLCLGCEKGYFPLGGLAGDAHELLAEYCASTDKIGYVTDEYQFQTLRLLRERFGLRPWTKPNRFDVLQERYRETLAYPPDAFL
jgi:hypothetical protein